MNLSWKVSYKKEAYYDCHVESDSVRKILRMFYSYATTCVIRDSLGMTTYDETMRINSIILLPVTFDFTFIHILSEILSVFLQLFHFLFRQFDNLKFYIDICWNLERFH